MIRKFSDFKKRDDLVTHLGLEINSDLLTPGEKTPPLQPSALLSQYLKEILDTPLQLINEQMAREGLIFPILLEIYKNFKDNISFFAGTEIETNGTAPGGVCDYVLTGKPRMDVPRLPFICVVEAKKQDFDMGAYQCGAELYACRIKNEQEGFIYPFYFGCVTTGLSWVFIKLEDNLLTRDRYYYTLENLPRLLGAWRWVLNQQLGIKNE